MPANFQRKQSAVRRRPQQARANDKVELILEAAVRLIERDGVAKTTTNAIAETAGVSIGTLYQYFDDKGAVLDALTDREMAGLSARVLKAAGGAPDTKGGRIPAIVRAVLSSYSGRRGAHRALLERALSSPTGGRLRPLYEALFDQAITKGLAPAGETSKPLPPADAFVLVHAIAGVLRAVVATENRRIPQAALEESLKRLIVGFVEGGGSLYMR
ncbi:MAG: TetR/AcrR family transcriptional regulator [Beijerinckiaceae bacterium]